MYLILVEDSLIGCRLLLSFVDIDAKIIQLDFFILKLVITRITCVLIIRNGVSISWISLKMDILSTSFRSDRVSSVILRIQVSVWQD